MARKSIVRTSKVYLIDDTILSNITLEDMKNVNFELLNNSIEFAELKDFIDMQKKGINHIMVKMLEKFQVVKNKELE